MASKPLNLLIFGIDSLRADHMSCYGYRRHTTPVMDRIAAQGVLFENAYSAYIPTTPGYSSMLTGRDVMSTQMVSLGPKGPLDPSQPTLGELLHEAGYVSSCVGFDGGFYRGFDKYAGFESWLSWEDRPARKAENLNEAAIPLMEEMATSGQPFCLFLRHMDPHSPYLAPPPFDKMFYSGDPCDPSKNSMKPVFDFLPFAEFFKSWMPPGITDIEYVIAAYDAELAYMDACIARLLTRLEELGHADDTLIVITSDHGETLADHDCYFDHHGLYEPTLHIPLIFHKPGLLPAGMRSSAYTLQEDLVPTILDMIGLKKALKSTKFDGKSNLQVIRGEVESHRSEFYITECTWMRKRGWRTPEWKFFESLEPDFHGKPAVELYNIILDPMEYNNVAAKEPELVECFRARMNAWVAKRMKETGKGDPILEYELGLGKSIGSIATAKALQSR